MASDRRGRARLTLAARLRCAEGFGCAGGGRGPAVPKDLQDRAVAAGMPNIRSWGDYVTPEFRDSAVEALHRKQAHWVATGKAEHPPAGSARSWNRRMGSPRYPGSRRGCRKPQRDCWGRHQTRTLEKTEGVTTV